MDLQAQRLFSVVIDAGHGGKDPGTVGNGGKEKEITLAVAKLVGKKIKASHPEVRVLFTRETDVFVGLQARADFANKHKASLMLSIHVNSAPTTSVHGTETYVLGLSKFANNLSVAMRENKAMLLESDYKTTYRGFDPTSTESYIMFDLMQDAYITKSIDFANRLQKRYRSSGRYSRGVRQDILWVLSQSAMPSVLTEIGFLTNKDEAAFMLSGKGQDVIAGAIAESFTSYYRAYQGKREKATEAKADTTKATDPPSPPPHEPYCKEPVFEPTEVATPTPQKLEKGEPEKAAKEEKGKNEKDKKEKAEATPTKQKGLTYRVQFLTSPKKLEPTDASFRHLPTAVERAKAGQQFIYLLQPTPSLEKAREQLRQLPPVYRDAFIVRYKDGVRQKG
ncbi:N-acetylmuramoyl-L-alanine amidase family protein [Porphyromonas catoniae]